MSSYRLNFGTFKSPASLAKITDQLKSFGRETAIMGGAITGALGVAVKQFADLDVFDLVLPDGGTVRLQLNDVSADLLSLEAAEDIARAALYLASDDAEFVNGTELFVDNGFSAV